MNLEEYINWHDHLDGEGVYKISPGLADKSTWGFKGMGKVDLPEIKNLYEKGGEEFYRRERMQYLGVRDDVLTKWAKEKWPFLKFMDAKIQIQRPGESVRPHLDLCGQYLTLVCEQAPWFKKIKHSYAKPGIDVWRLVIAMEDHVDGQIFSFNDQEWKWQSGDCIRINSWRALHWTENRSNKDRPIIKVTAINPSNKPEF
jgi:hypothetical protein|tara:strand:- start:634 stop:1233 length:600 start_codon:yes stop_codon:yes gene_type:complete